MAELGVIALHPAMHAPATWEYELTCSISSLFESCRTGELKRLRLAAFIA